VVRKWLLPTLSEILAKAESTGIDLLVPELSRADSFSHSDVRAETLRDRQAVKLKAESQWQSAIAAIESLLLQVLPSPLGLADMSEETVIEGLLITSPLPLFSHPAIVSQLQTIAFTTPHPQQLQLAPSNFTQPSHLQLQPQQFPHFPIDLLPSDPLADERFCLVFTHSFSLVVVLGEENGNLRCQFSFDPQDLTIIWQSLRGRIMLTAPHQLAYLDELAARFPPIEPNYRWVMEFSQYLLQHQPVAILAPTQPTFNQPHVCESPAKPAVDVELLQALTHEIRTPLTTIRTMTRLLLRQPDLVPKVLKRLGAIDRECTEQINRMELIFSAVELSTDRSSQTVPLTTMSIGQLLEQSLPHWQQQAERRNLHLAVDIPHKLPAVVSNPTILDRVLTGVVESFTRNLPSGSHIQVEVSPVGDRLKLQLQSHSESSEYPPIPTTHHHSNCKSSAYAIGELLTFQPETGNLSLNMSVTKNLFQLLGGKLIIRQHPQQGEILTIFLPLSMISHA
jgi:signal transduction histidine kinase